MTRLPNLTKLLNTSGQNDVIISLDDFINRIKGELTLPQQTFLLNQDFERAINIGGFYGFFLNSGGDFAQETIVSLKAINALKTVDILQKAIDQFPNTIVPKSSKERLEIIEQSEHMQDAWNTLDERFYKYEDDLNALNIEYVRKKIDLF